MNNILDLIPQRPPFLMVDKIIDIEQEKHIITLKNLSQNEAFFTGNIPDNPVMPETLLIESMTQSALALVLSKQDLSGRTSQLTHIEKTEFLGQAYPGDQLRIEVGQTATKKEHLHFAGKILVDGTLICRANFSFTLSAIPSKPKIHPTASVHPSAILGKDVAIGPYTIVSENVIIGDRTTLKAHVYIDKWTKIGEDNHINFGTVIGSEAQDHKYSGEESWVTIGDRNEIREYVTINRATGEGEKTQIGSDSMLMTNVHIGHNCIVEDRVTMANAIHVAGHVKIEEDAIIGGLTGIHQFCKIGKGSMIGGYARVSQDIPPFMICEGNPAYVRGINAIGLRRSDSTPEEIKSIKEAYKFLYRSGLNLKQALKEIPFNTDHPKLIHLINFLKEDTSRGISKKQEAPTQED